MAELKFKVGDRVKWVGPDGGYHLKNGVVDEIATHGPYPYWVLFETQPDPLLCHEDELESVNESLDNPA